MQKLLQFSQQDLIDLESELELVKNYIELEQARTKKQIRLIVTKGDSICIRQVKIPIFILQPLVENAIWHGILECEKSQGLIEITVNEKANYFILSVKDDGAGIGNSTFSSNSIALKNINERLAIFDNQLLKNYIKIENKQPGTLVTLLVCKKKH